MYVYAFVFLPFELSPSLFFLLSFFLSFRPDIFVVVLTMFPPVFALIFFFVMFTSTLGSFLL